MHTLRSILSYSLLILVVAAAAAAYYYRDQLQPHVSAGYHDAVQLWETGIEKYIDRDAAKVPLDDAAEKSAVVARVEQAVVIPREAPPAASKPNPSSRQQPQALVVPGMNAEPASAPLSSSDNVAAPQAPVMDEYEQVLSAYHSEPEVAKADTAEPMATEKVPLPAADDSAATEPLAGQSQVAAEPVQTQGHTDLAVASSRPAQQDHEPAPAVKSEEPVTPAATAVSPFEPARLTATPDVSPVIRAEAEEAANDDDREIQTAETELLRSARHHFWLGEFSESVSAYRKLIEMDPEEANVLGELGNVYYAMGQWKQAGQAYYAAAERLLARGRLEPVYYLHYVIQGLDPELAEKLKNRMKQ